MMVNLSTFTTSTFCCMEIYVCNITKTFEYEENVYKRVIKTFISISNDIPSHFITHLSMTTVIIFTFEYGNTHL